MVSQKEIFTMNRKIPGVILVNFSVTFNEILWLKDVRRENYRYTRLIYSNSKAWFFTILRKM